MHMRQHANAMQPEKGYLRLETKSSRKTKHSYSVANSAHDDKGQPPVPSLSWAFPSQSPSYVSHSSSVTSLGSCIEETSPEPTAFPIPYSLGTQCGAFEALPSDASKLHGNYVDSDFLQNSPVSAQACTSFSDNQWVMVPQNIPCINYGLHHPDHPSFVPTYAHFSPSIEPSLVGSQDTSPISTQARLWRQEQYMTQVAHEQQLHQQGNGIPHNVGYPWMVPANVILPSTTLDGSSIMMPSDAMPAIFGYAESDLEDFDEMENKNFVLASPESECGSYPGPQDLDAENEGPYRPGNHGWGMTVGSDGGAKIAQPGKRHHQRLRLKAEGHSEVQKRQRSRCTKAQTKVYRDSLGRHFQCLSSKGKNWKCTEQLGGYECGKTFERVEHLRRHEKTHKGEKDFPCPLPARFNCGKRLDRRDNWRDHLKTHLRKSVSGRNERCKKEEMYHALRESVDQEESEKTIAILEKWFSEEATKQAKAPNTSAQQQQRD